MPFFKEQLVGIRGFVFDVDGVLASAKTVLHPSGDLMRTMNTKDGYAIYRALEQGYKLAIISGAKSESIRTRFSELGVDWICLNSMDKLSDLKEFIQHHDLKPEELLYMGDDIPDAEAMRYVGLATCPNDAVEEIQATCNYISDLPGGEGCVRDVIEQVLRAQKKWQIRNKA
ncbi:MAG: HAD hydrolase family protein [Bacteroidetes bacterium]|jgi:3-deoxy-D-manno-octulosonate 8-phosphate phosphatase (KDO 8-P phosphatase)|nr:HAD hydrolase family protein [Bacteroidota bacterium]MBT3749109.1 HAD hydrolase family protein [Bacteroidota bacterium]MBT4399696.1 HAD hydrolase family protein [Bacteroidota bacterium]MBT4409899.1 HAD hydrolase family protein [Bacteroidota bacterium]MBT5425743.1 HAD hydrolase family protein [Bacteroidota bacterium]